MKYYALAIQKDGQSVLIDNLTDFHASALKEAKAHCKANGLTFQSIQFIKGTERQPGTLAKKFASGKSTRKGRR